MGIPISQFIEMFGLPENNAHRFDVGVIGDVVKDVHYGTAKKAIDKGKYIYLRMNNITYDGELDLSDIKRIDVPDKDLPGCMVQIGDVLFNRTNSKDLVGKTCCFSDDEPMIIAGYIIRLRMNGKVLPEYLSVFMNLERSKKMLYSMAKGAVGQANINAKEVQSIEIVIPPMDIQNSFLTLSRQSDKSKFACLKSQFIEMFKYINHDEYKTLDDVCILITDGTHNPPKFVESGIPFILVSNITGNIVTYETPKYITENDYRVLMKRTPIEKGDVLLSTVGSYGHPAIVTEDRPFAFQRHIAHLKPNRDLLTSEYLHAAILSSIVQEQIEILILGVAQKTLNLSAIRQIKIPVPSIEEQNVFVSFVEQSDKSKLCFHLHTTALYYTHS